MYMVAIILKCFMHQYSGKFRWSKFLQNASRHSRRNFSVFIFVEHEPFTVSWVASVFSNFKGRVANGRNFPQNVTNSCLPFHHGNGKRNSSIESFLLTSYLLAISGSPDVFVNVTASDYCLYKKGRLYVAIWLFATTDLGGARFCTC